jgi:superfamily I DNA/RNA helicase
MARVSRFKAEAVIDPEIEAAIAELKPVETERVWSSQQRDIFDWFEGVPPRSCPKCQGTGIRKGNIVCGCSDGLYDRPSYLVVRARAGTGKTTTIIEGVNRAPESSILVCAFNKKIAEELNSRITNPNAVAKTLHALGFAAIRKQWPRVQVAQGTARGDDLTAKVCPKSTPKPICRLVTMLHTKARDMMPMTPQADTLTALALEFDYIPDEGWSDYPLERIVGWATDAMAVAAKEDPKSIDFSDMIYLPLVWNLLSPDYDMVVVDEAQDMTLAQLTIAQRSCSGRLCVVGDDKQAIYGFRGADSGSLDRLKAELQAGELPLTTTYRCGQSIVRRAQVLVSDIQAGLTNPEGVVDNITYDALIPALEAGCFVLSRLNAPLVSLTLACLKSGRRARMAGRDIGAGIQAILKKLGITELSTIQDMASKLDKWEAKAVTRYASYGQDALVDRTRDQAAMLRALAEEAEDGADLLNRINWLFEEPINGVADHIVCSSVHKAKGLEAERVFVLQESFYRRGWTQEEANIEYVATTRAKSHLTFVTGVPSLCR